MANNRIVLEVNKREVSGKKVAALREQDLIPAVIYGADFAPTNIEAPTLAIRRVVSAAGTHTPVDVMIDGKPQTAIIKTIDVDPVRNRIRHVAFQAVSRDQVVTTEIPVVIVGEDDSEAKKAGLVILQAVEELEVRAKPDDLPERLEVSAAELKEHGDKLTVADVKLPTGVEFTDHDEEFRSLTLATVYEPSAIAAANEAADKAADEEKKAAAETPAEPAAAESAEGDKPADVKSE
ncbi:MAG: 50S ribosomal protein L25 [Candidatus Nomurabacteria bacterium]|jgi:large subunit ribosomal protein L25|nr:50S ribosomal protein L25 [Candidatus Nomurabacteria bacterium]